MPGSGSPVNYEIFSDYLKTSGASNDARQNGTLLAPIDLYFENTATDRDKFITMASVFLVDNTINHNNFGALPQLTNGIDIICKQRGTEHLIATACRSLGELASQIPVTAPAASSNVNYWTIDNVGGFTGAGNASDAFKIDIDFRFFSQYGFMLGRGNNDRLILRIKDNLTSIAFFRVKIYGNTYYY